MFSSLVQMALLGVCYLSGKGRGIIFGIMYQNIPTIIVQCSVPFCCGGMEFWSGIFTTFFFSEGHFAVGYATCFQVKVIHLCRHK